MSDAGFIVLGWLTKLTLSLALLGLLAFDGLALVTTKFAASDHANAAAYAAAETYADTKDVAKAQAAADVVALKNTETLDEFVVMENGLVTVELRRAATTLWMHRIGPLKRFTVISASGEGRPAT